MLNQFKFHLLLLTCACALSAISTISCHAAPSTPAVPTQIVLPSDRTSGQSGSSLLLAENGKALMPIVIAANASPQIKETANYLAEKLQKITGAKWEIQTGDGASGLVLGTWQQFPIPALKKPLEIRQPIQDSKIQNGEEAFAIRTEDKRLLLLGGGELGVSHAAARFLELVGYRRFYPSSAWEVVPDLKVLKFNRDETDRPTILARRFSFSYGYGPEDAATPENEAWPRERRSAKPRADLQAWEKQNRFANTFHIYNAHNYARIIEENQKEFDAHPEYYSLIGGVRVPRTVCISNPNVRRMAVEVALNYLEKYADETDMYSMEPGDGDAMCECEVCAAMGTYSDRVFGLANEAARAVKAKFPGQGKMIGVGAYNTHDIPPKFEMEPNVHVAIAAAFITGPYPFRELVRQWRAKTPSVGVYEYFSTFQWGQDRLRPRNSAGPTGDIKTLQSTIDFLASQHILSLVSESSVAWGAHGRGNYLAGKLMWNPQTDVNAALQDFYAKAFGPAAAPMKRYFERVDGENEQFSNTLVGLAMRDIEEASTLSKDRPDVLARLGELKQFMYYNYLYARFIAAKDKAEQAPWLFEILKHEYRTRNSYMTHWRAVGAYAEEYARDFNQPLWAYETNEEYLASQKAGRPMRVPSWYSKDEFTPEETERKFQEALEYFKPTLLLQAANYSDDLVAVDWGATEKPSPDFEIVGFKRGTVFLFSTAGEPLSIDLTGVKNNANVETFYALQDKSGKQITQGTIPSDDKKHRVSLKVPRAGLYQLNINARGHWLYSVPSGTPNGIFLRDQQDLSSYTTGGYAQQNYFYVPKGLKEFQFFWGGDKSYIYFPDGAVAAEVPAMSDYFTVQVPDGQDGKVWSFVGKHQPRQFVNIPNFISPWKEGLMVPRELAEKDGLKIRQ